VKAAERLRVVCSVQSFEKCDACAAFRVHRYSLCLCEPPQVTAWSSALLYGLSAGRTLEALEAALPSIAAVWEANISLDEAVLGAAVTSREEVNRAMRSEVEAAVTAAGGRPSADPMDDCLDLLNVR
jgi:hypothetical protein